MRKNTIILIALMMMFMMALTSCCSTEKGRVDISDEVSLLFDTRPSCDFTLEDYSQYEKMVLAEPMDSQFPIYQLRADLPATVLFGNWLVMQEQWEIMANYAMTLEDFIKTLDENM